MSTQLHPSSFNAAVRKDANWERQLELFFQNDTGYSVSKDKQGLVIAPKQKSGPVHNVLNAIAPGFVVTPKLLLHPGTAKTQPRMDKVLNGRKDDLSSLSQKEYQFLDCTIMVDPALNGRLRYSPAWCIAGFWTMAWFGKAGLGVIPASAFPMLALGLVFIGLGSWGCACARYARSVESYRSLLTQAMSIQVGTYTWH